MFKKLALTVILVLLSVSVYALDVRNKTYESEIDGQYYKLKFENSNSFGPGYTGYVNVYTFDTLVSILTYQQNVGDSIVRIDGNLCIMYQSPSDILTFVLSSPQFIRSK